MKKLWVLAALVLFTIPAAQANGRYPCDRGAGGVSHCSGKKFVCNNGTVSGSTRVCTAGAFGASGGKGAKGKKSAGSKASAGRSGGKGRR